MQGSSREKQVPSSGFQIVDSEGKAAKSDQLKSGREEGYQESILIYKKLFVQHSLFTVEFISKKILNSKFRRIQD